MDKTQLQKIIAEFYERLPLEAQTIFSSMSWLEILKEISSNYNLSQNQIEILGTETTLALLGIIHFDEYQTILDKELSLPRESTKKLISEINEKIFNKLLPILNKTYTQNIEYINNLEPEMDTRFSSLPENLQEAIANSNYQQKIYDIGEKYKLQIPQMASLEEITIQFMIGKISSSKYESDLALATDLEATKTSEIAKEVNDTILANIREYMKNGSTSDSSINEDIEVPIPPYKTTPRTEEEKVPQAQNNKIESTTILPSNNTITSDKGIFADAGIEMMEENKIPTSNEIVSGKLFSPTKNTNTIINQTIPKINTETLQAPNPNANQKVVDPYHEAI